MQALSLKAFQDQLQHFQRLLPALKRVQQLQIFLAAKQRKGGIITMEKKNNSSNNFLNGLLMGAAVGAGAFYLFGTQRGKELVKKMKDQGKDLLSEFDDFVEDGAEEAMMEDEFVENTTNGPEVVQGTTPERTTKPKKRVFKGTKKTT